MRKQIINFKQGEDEGIDQASERFNELVEKEPKLVFTGDSVSMSAGEDTHRSYQDTIENLQMDRSRMGLDRASF